MNNIRENNTQDANVTNNQTNKEKTECEILREHREVRRERFTNVTKISNRTKGKKMCEILPSNRREHRAYIARGSNVRNNQTVHRENNVQDTNITHNKTEHRANSVQETNVTINQTEHREHDARGIYVTINQTQHRENSARDCNVTNNQDRTQKKTYSARDANVTNNQTGEILHDTLIIQNASPSIHSNKTGSGSYNFK